MSPDKQRFWSGVQGVTGLVFAGFLTLHTVNTAFAVTGPSRYDAVQDLFRVVYQHPLVEIPVLVSLMLHVVASIAKSVGATAAAVVEPTSPRTGGGGRRWQVTRRGLHSAAGWAILPLVGVHVTATRFNLPEGVRLHFNGVAHTIHRLPGGFLPYYVLLGAAGTAHLLLGLPTAAVFARRWVGGRAMVPLVRRLPTAVVAAACIAVVAGVCAMAGFIFAVTIDTSDPAVANFDHELGFLRGTPLWREF
jgi:succinate dehydrogenase/fumarate reductase cytochrome b subunit